jgi:hypothetical protein
VELLALLSPSSHTLCSPKNFQDDFIAMIKLWGPSDCVQFVLPIHIRMPFRHAVSFFWTAYVSFTRGSIDKEESAPVVNGAPSVAIASTE